MVLFEAMPRPCILRRMNRTIPGGDGPREARFNQLTVTRFVTDIAKAVGHSNSRNGRVVQVACFFSLIRSSTPNLNTARVMIEAAQRQMFSSTTGYQAAHYLPGQLKIHAAGVPGAETPWSLVSGLAARQRLEYLFADVEHLPAEFNKADSAAESKGLRETFRLFGEHMLRDPGTFARGSVNKVLVRRLYDNIWVDGAMDSYNAAISQKMQRSEVPPLQFDDQGNITNLEARGNADWSPENIVAILQRYCETLRTAPPELSDGKIAEVERLFTR
jgi:hypothetical protein